MAMNPGPRVSTAQVCHRHWSESQAIAMSGHGGANPLARAGSWVADHAAALGEPVSIGLLCETAVDRLDVSGATLTVDPGSGWPETRYATDALGAGLAELQLTVGEGPCVDAERGGGPVLVTDLDAPGTQLRWPLFTPLAVDAGARALFAFPLCVGAIRAGVLALHRAQAGSLEPAKLTDALALAGLALRLLLDEQADRRAGSADRADGLPLHDPQVHQATGMISGQLGVGMEEAFARLRARAFAGQRPLAELAADVVARRLRFEPTEDTT
jgi:hypothetical protein